MVTNFISSVLTVETLASSMFQTKEKCDSFVSSRSDLWMIWKCHDTRRIHNYYFCLEPTVRHLDESDFHYCYGMHSKVAFWKLFDHSYVQSSFSIITRHLENSILKDTLQLNILRTWINLCAKSFIKTWVNMEKRSMKVSEKRSFSQKSKCALQRTLHLSRPRFTYFMRFFFSQT